MKRGFCYTIMLAALALPAPASADDVVLGRGLSTSLSTSWSSDEPFPRRDDEPGLHRSLDAVPESSSGWGEWWLRTELSFGWASLVDDPDVGEGYGGGLSFTLGFHRRVGLEVGFFFGNNPYSEELGDIGSSFLAGALTTGPSFHLLDPDGRLNLTLDAGIGWYIIIPPPILQDEAWTFGVYAGASFGVKIFSWLGVGVKVRYHLFNLTTVSGEDLRDVKAFQEMGVVDRFELPFYIAFYN